MLVMSCTTSPIRLAPSASTRTVASVWRALETARWATPEAWVTWRLISLIEALSSSITSVEAGQSR